MSSQQYQPGIKENKFYATSDTKNEIASNSSEILKEIVNQTETTVTTEASGLETINDDCLLHIIKFLNIIDVISLAATCKQLLNFAKAEIFPKKVKTINIGTHFGAYKIPTLSEYPLSPDSLEFAFSYFGEFVIELTVQCHLYARIKSKIGRIYTILKHCKNLQTLQIIDFDFTFDETHGLQNIIEQFQNLKELNLLGSTGITNNWLPTLNGLSKIDKLTITAKNKISDNFCRNLKNLCHLTVDFDYYTAWCTYDIEKIFYNNRNCLTHLKLSHLYHMKYYESVGEIITKKLPKLEWLALGVRLVHKSHGLINLPHLKSLEIYSQHYTASINPLLRTLSDNDTIKELRICNGVFDDDDMMSTPSLIFNKLQRFCCSEPNNTLRFLKLMTRSQMPAIHSFELTQFETKESNNLLRFIETKETLKFIRLYLNGSNSHVLTEFFRQIIGILNKPNRTFLNLEIFPLKLGDEEVTKIIIYNTLS